MQTESKLLNRTTQLEEPSPAAKGGKSANSKLFPVLIAMVVYAAVRNLAEATIKPLWFDELLTEVVSRQPGISGVWRALKTAVDGHPPPFYLIERVASGLAFNEHIAYRLPSILAFSCTLICLYVFVARRNGPLLGIVCASLIFLTPLYTYYADEARPYSMFVACIAFALVCYQRVPRIPWTIGLFLSLLLATCLHYFGIVALLPFLAAEFFFALDMRQLRVPVWGALLLPALSVVAFRPLLNAMRVSYAHFWARPQLLGALQSYGELFGVDTPWGFALAGIAAIAVILAFLQSSRKHLAKIDSALRSEYALVLAFVAYPAIVFFAARFTHAGYTSRYVLCTILGVAIAFGYFLEWLQPQGVVIAGALLFLALGAQEFTFWRTLPSNIGAPARPAEDMLALVNSVHLDGLPLVVSDSGRYFEILHYAAPELRARMVAVVDPASAYAYSGSDTVENILLALRQLAPVDVRDFAEFTATHESFLLYSNGSSYDWLPDRLVRGGFTTRELADPRGGILFLVERQNAQN